MSIRSIRALSLMLMLGLVACGNSQAPAAIVKVFKSDGSTQCSNDGTSVEEMSMELTSAGIDVFCGQKGHDGMAQCQACGICGTGQINVYSINSQSVPDAESLGFAPVSDLPHYRDTPCS